MGEGSKDSWVSSVKERHSGIFLGAETSFFLCWLLLKGWNVMAQAGSPWDSSAQVNTVGEWLERSAEADADLFHRVKG